MSPGDEDPTGPSIVVVLAVLAIGIAVVIWLWTIFA